MPLLLRTHPQMELCTRGESSRKNIPLSYISLFLSGNPTQLKLGTKVRKRRRKRRTLACLLACTTCNPEKSFQTAKMYYSTYGAAMLYLLTAWHISPSVQFNRQVLCVKQGGEEQSLMKNVSFQHLMFRFISEIGKSKLNIYNGGKFYCNYTVYLMLHAKTHFK